MPLSIPRRTIVCSPWAGDTQRNRHYAQDCMRDSLARGEAPFLSHLLYTQVLIDAIPEERKQGLICEGAWLTVAHLVVLYVDLGMSPGMGRTYLAAMELGIPTEERRLGDPWSREAAR